MKKIIVTGSNGFIGRFLVDYLSASGKYVVVALVRNGGIPGFNLNKNVEVKSADLTNKDSLLKAIDEGSIVVNLAANPYDPKLSYEVNVKGTQNLIDICKIKNVNKIIQISSQAVKIKSKGVYAKTKLESELLIKNSGLDWIILRPSLVYGPGEKGLFNKIKNLVQTIPFVPVFGNGESKLNPLYIGDFCKAVELVIDDKKGINLTFDLGSNKSISYNELYKGVLKSVNKNNVKILNIPIWMGLFFGKIFEILKFKKPPFFIDNVLGSTQKIECNSLKFTKKYALKFLDFKGGLKKLSEKNKINVAVIGLGKMGLMHLSILSMMTDVKITALVDSNKALFKMIKSMGVVGNFYSDIDSAFEKEKIDAVFILTPTFTHYDLLLKCVYKNKYIFVEKPLCLGLEQWEKLNKSIKSDSRFNKIVVGYTLLYRKIFIKLAEIISLKEYGRIKFFEASYLHSEVFGERKGWIFNKKLSGGGVLMNPGPHLFSIINLLFGVPVFVKAKIKSKYSSNVDDEAQINLKYKNYEAMVNLSWSTPGYNVPKTNIKINFEKAVITTDGMKIIIKEGNKKTEEINESDLPDLIENIFNLNPEANGDAYYIEDRLFIDSVKNKSCQKLPNSLAKALIIERIIFDSYTSSKN
jgi:NADH dehydrogenase